MPANKYLHHKHKKKHKNSWSTKSIVDRVCMCMAVVMPLTTLPQIIQLYSSKETAVSSLLMWLLYFVSIIPFFAVWHTTQSSPAGRTQCPVGCYAVGNGHRNTDVFINFYE